MASFICTIYSGQLAVIYDQASYDAINQLTSNQKYISNILKQEAISRKKNNEFNVEINNLTECFVI
jgi:hypothetical protein